MRRKKSPPLKPDFSGSAKKARGIAPRDLAADIKRLEGELKLCAKFHEGILERTQGHIRTAIAALDDGRRGEGMQILRALVRRTDGKIDALKPTEPEAA